MTKVIDKTEQPKILLVDANEESRTSLKTVLEFNQFQVTIAATLREALNLIETKDFDVLLSDLNLPGAADGFAAVSAMRHANPNAVTLMFTAYPAMRDVLNAILLQGDEVLMKPLRPVTLVAQIRQKLQEHGLFKMTNT